MPKVRFAVATIAAVACLAGALTATAIAQGQRFPDVPPDHYAYEAIEWAAEAGVTVGYGDGTFQPDEPLPRWGGCGVHGALLRRDPPSRTV